MAAETIHPATRLGYVHLTVSNLEQALSFYQQSLGFQVHSRENGTARLGAGREDLVVLTEQPQARRVAGTTGLYHFAILVPSRLELARSLRHLGETRTPLQGFSDHLVSEAIYLADPDGNGIEIYRDRPRSEWQYDQGRLRMATDPLDIQGLLAELNDQPETWSGLHPETVLGHVHLHVAHINQAETFYVDVLGFELMVRYGPTASFLAAGGYHHHLGINTWNGVGAPPPPPDAVGLRWYIVYLPDEAELNRVAARVRQAGLPLEERPEGLLLHDPAGNGLILSALTNAAEA
jgi:catechol 2,3-dioxygenase